jgi:hypothetical protein
MRRFMTASAGVLLGAILTAGGVAAAETAGAVPTFNNDVAPILYRNCVRCHRPNQIAPMSLLSYQEARPWAKAIKEKVRAREMPPWFADPRFGHFTNDKSLTQAEVDTIAAWVDAGAPQGSGFPPPLPRFSDAGWNHPSGRDPDVIAQLPVEWKIAAEGEVPNFNLYAPMPFSEAKVAEAVQVLPGNVAATHHIIVDVVNLPRGGTLGTGPAWPGGPVTSNVAVAAEPGATFDNREDASAAAGMGMLGFGGYVPGGEVRVAPPGRGLLVRADLYKHIKWNLHYQATGRPETARPAVGIWWQKGPVTSVEQGARFLTQISESKPLMARAGAKAIFFNELLAPIPPYDANWTVTGVAAIRDDVTLHGFGVHMHLRGKSMTYVVTYPDGREEVLLHVPNYDFNWQLPYELMQPVKVPAGSTIKAIAVYDNSAAKRMNPAPNKEVYWSEQSWDDMFLPSARFTVDKLARQPQTSNQGQQP